MWITLVLFLLWLKPGSGQNETAGDTFVVCTLGRVAPMASCTPGDDKSFAGLSVEIFRATARDGLNWQEGRDYRFECLSGGTLETLQNEILPANGSCDAFIAATTITSERSEMGVVWAYPYWSGSIGIITRSTPKSTDGWAWTKPFTWSLWLAIGVTVVVLPIIVYYLEVLSIKRRVTMVDSLMGYMEATWRTLWVMIQGETMSVSMFGARIVVIVLAFVALILSASYTANLAAFLTLKSFSSVNSIYDLQGLAVSTVEAYQNRIQAAYGLKTLETKLTTRDDLTKEAGQVAMGSLAAFLYDTEAAQYLVATWPECRLRLLPETIEPFDYGLAFNSRTDPAIVNAFSLSILRLIEDGTIRGLGDIYLLENSPCLSQGINNDDIGQITFTQVYGLWVLILAGIVLGIIIVTLIRIYKIRKGSWSSTPADRLPSSATMLQHKFERGDSRERGKSDLLTSESDLSF